MADNRYQNGKIYKITAVDGEGPCYVGSTCQKYLSSRLRGHQAHFNHWQKTGKKYTTSFELLKEGEVQITLIEPFPTHSLDELSLLKSSRALLD